MGCAVAEGLAKLVMHQSRWKADSQGRMEDADIVRVRLRASRTRHSAPCTSRGASTWRVQVLVRLLTAYMDPATEPATAARQCLSVFFPAYTGFSAWHHRLLCDAVVPAARRTLGLPAKSAAPNLLRFCLQLLQASLFPPIWVTVRQRTASCKPVESSADQCSRSGDPGRRRPLASGTDLPVRSAGVPKKCARETLHRGPHQSGCWTSTEGRQSGSRQILESPGR